MSREVFQSPLLWPSGKFQNAANASSVWKCLRRSGSCKSREYASQPDARFAVSFASTHLHIRPMDIILHSFIPRVQVFCVAPHLKGLQQQGARVVARAGKGLAAVRKQNSGPADFRKDERPPATGRTGEDGPGLFLFRPLNSVFKPRMTRLNCFLSASIAATPARRTRPSSSQACVIGARRVPLALIELRHLAHLPDFGNPVHGGAAQ